VRKSSTRYLRSVSSRAPAEQPRARGSVALGMKSAAIELWGKDALTSIAESMSSESRLAMFDELLLPISWVPESSVIEFWRVAWDGPLAESTTATQKYVEKAVQHGWGRFRKVFVSLMTPTLLANRAQQLWRHDHTHGELTATMSGNTGLVRLADHAYVDSPVACRFMAASFHVIVAMSNARDVTSSYDVHDRRALRVKLAWR
jgi:hypothetical protein